MQTQRDMASSLHPDLFMSITMDAKAPVPLPHFVRLPKGTIKTVRVPYNVFGLINFGQGQFEYYNHFDHWPKHDANICISYLWDHIRKHLVKGNNFIENRAYKL